MLSFGKYDWILVLGILVSLALATWRSDIGQYVPVEAGAMLSRP